ncbi:MAG: hypothetical protein A3G34_09440 [Candidatus Lindowbacteria bacterium RIFCSPLOWO2_12_FULL_62_27]|nr:MAG: hypothetical protein A3I06_08105 [Candidatus Lindowbacteria bacterium RIFCSPLOWO2_02_FULL_62_12]OGH60260.1 MAG: hypothetical protein A3G34_09440 [Candidatus Lindowbacteria bacterium RIFCSPLOWO2_12_FULL_62_27]
MAIVGAVMMLLSAAALLYVFSAFLSDPAGVGDAGTWGAGGADPPSPAARAAEAIAEMEMDLAAGKISREDFETIRSQAVAELAAELKKGRA